MKINSLTLVVAALCGLFLSTEGANAQGTAFTYQGRLTSAGQPANGLYDFRFRLALDPLADNYVGSSFLTNGVQVTNGLFVVTMDFGSGPWNGSNLWLELDVRTNLGSGYTMLNPLQALTPAPYAIFASAASNAVTLSGTVPSAGLNGVYGGAVTFNNPGDSFSGNGGGLTNVNATTLGGLSAAKFWQTGGNSGTLAGVNFVGTTDNQALELHVFGQRALLLQPDPSTNASPNFIAGSPFNAVAAGIIGATIGGGGASYFSNQIMGSYNTIGGGFGNTTGTTNFNTFQATVGGGADNTASGISSTIAGGSGNVADNNDAAIAGGFQNRANFRSAVAGGQQNLADGADVSIGGGQGNNIQTNTEYAHIGGGFFNFIIGNNSEAGATIGGGGVNYIYGSSFLDSVYGVYECFSTIGGGFLNSIQFDSVYGTIGGGRGNSIQADSPASVIGGGTNNEIQADAISAVIAGGANNSVQSFASGAAIGGGYDNSVGSDYSTVAGGESNTVTSSEATIGGGQNNVNEGYGSVIAGGVNNNLLGANASQSVIGGGGYNTNAGYECVIGGGGENNILSPASLGFIGSGFYNQLGGTNQITRVGFGSDQLNTISGGGGNYIAAGAGANSISGGANNAVQTNSQTSAIAGGFYNTIGANVTNSVILAGAYNSVQANNCLAAGNESYALNPGSFVWSDGTLTYTPSIASNSVTMRASGGYRFFTGTGSAGAQLAAGATSWSILSDRNAKKNIAPVDGAAVLAKLAGVPISQWNYNWENDSDTPNVGPMAQDFKHAFYPGRDDKTISTLEFDGVELAAIQGLNQKLEAQAVALKTKEAEIQELRQTVAELQQAVSHLARREGAAKSE